jgi:hypothetical protein
VTDIAEHLGPDLPQLVFAHEWKREVIGQEADIGARADQQQLLLHALGDGARVAESGVVFMILTPVTAADGWKIPYPDQTDGVQILPEQRMPDAAIEGVDLTIERAIFDAAHLVRETSDGEIQVSAHDLRLEGLRRALLQFQPHQRRLYGKGRNRGVEPERGVAGDTIHHTDSEVSRKIAAYLRDVGHEPVHHAQQALRHVGDVLAAFRQLEAAAPALAQSEPQPQLERSDLRGDGRQADIQLGLSRSKAPVAHDSVEHAQEPNIRASKLHFHALDLFTSGNASSCVRWASPAK